MMSIDQDLLRFGHTHVDWMLLLTHVYWMFLHGSIMTLARPTSPMYVCDPQHRCEHWRRRSLKNETKQKQMLKVLSGIYLSVVCMTMHGNE